MACAGGDRFLKRNVTAARQEKGSLLVNLHVFLC